MSKQILSVGIDIGTATTCLVFSDLTIENMASTMHLPRAQIVEKTVRYRSALHLTPLLSGTELDADAIAAIVRQEYALAGIRPEAVQTGAVIITGDTARKSNAQSVLQRISQYAGDFVVATAGPQLEGILAGKGSGAEQQSIETGKTVCNMDIGGGTTNTAIFAKGKILNADCLDIGGRLIRFHSGTSRIAAIFPKIQALAVELGIAAEIGSTLTLSQISAITDSMAAALLEKLRPLPRSPLYFRLKTEQQEEIPSAVIDAVSFSGGVGRLICEEPPANPLEYDDIGVFLAASIRTALDTMPFPVFQPKETIGATVIGAGHHCVALSGATITITCYEALPLQNLPILHIEQALSLPSEDFCAAVEQKLRWVQGKDASQNVALNIQLGKRIGFGEVCLLAEKIVAATKTLLQETDTLIVLTQEDYGKVLGQSLQVRLPEGQRVICMDSIDVGTADYLDIGKPLGIGDAVPVMVKTLAFRY